MLAGLRHREMTSFPGTASRGRVQKRSPCAGALLWACYSEVRSHWAVSFSLLETYSLHLPTPAP